MKADFKSVDIDLATILPANLFGPPTAEFRRQAQWRARYQAGQSGQSSGQIIYPKIMRSRTGRMSPEAIQPQRKESLDDPGKFARLNEVRLFPSAGYDTIPFHSIPTLCCAQNPRAMLKRHGIYHSCDRNGLLTRAVRCGPLSAKEILGWYHELSYLFVRPRTAFRR
jgi:hypothetical protein